MVGPRACTQPPPQLLGVPLRPRPRRPLNPGPARTLSAKPLTSICFHVAGPESLRAPGARCTDQAPELAGHASWSCNTRNLHQCNQQIEESGLPNPPNCGRGQLMHAGNFGPREGAFRDGGNGRINTHLAVLEQLAEQRLAQGRPGYLQSPENIISKGC